MHQRRGKTHVGAGVRGEIFHKIISLENLFLAWREFRRGKRKKREVQELEFNLEDNLFQLHQELKTKIYQHSNYTSFYVHDPKLRHIHKARIRDRVLHHAVFRILYPIFHKTFIYDSFSCRIDKGTHRAVFRLEKFCRKLGRNNHLPLFALKCDIRRFFDSVDQKVLLGLIRMKIKDENTLWLIQKIVQSFEKKPGKGLPLGNVTSQLFANIYLNELDQFVKHTLGVKRYLRYTDDFIILHESREYLKGLLSKIAEFLGNNLKLNLHPKKVTFRKISQGIDFLGYIVLPHYCVLRSKTKKRMLRKISKKYRALEGGLVT